MIKYTCGAGTPEEAETNCTYFIRGECTASFCEYRMKKQTNADRIRAMNDEELAIQILKNIPMHAWPDSVRKIYFSYDKPSKENPKKAWLEWLQQPPKGE